MALIDHHQVIKAFGPNDVHDPLADGIGGRRPRRAAHAGDAELCQPLVKVAAIDGIPVVDQEPGLPTDRSRLQQLAPDPGCGRTERRFLELGDGYLIGGMGWTTPTPLHTFREASGAELAAQLERLMSACTDPANAVLDVRVPPHGVLDVCPLLDASVDPPRPVVRGGQIETSSVGSHAVRQLILEAQPPLALCGHVRESKGAVKLGRTLVVNPGSEYHDGVLRGALIRLDHGRVANYQLISG